MIKIFRDVLIAKYTTVRHFYLISSLFAGMIVLFSITFLVNDYVSLRSDILHDVRMQNDRIKQRFFDSLLYSKHIMRYIGKQIANNENRDQKFINTLLASYRIPEDGIMSWSTFSWANQNHQITVSGNYGVVSDNKNPNLAERDYIPLTVKYPEVLHSGRPVYGALSELWSIPVGYGVIDTHRKYIGAIVTGIVIENLRAQLERLAINQNIFFAVIDLRHGIITKSISINNSKVDSEFLEKFVSKIKESDESKISYKTGYYQKMDDYPYGIITFYDKEVYDSVTRNHLVIYLIVIFSIVIFIGITLYGFHRHLIMPIKTLNEIATKIHHGNSDHEIPEFTVAEINDLAKTLGKIDKALSQNRAR